LSSLWELSTPKNIRYLWGFGRFLIIVISLQIVSGLFLAFYYVRGVSAWVSIVEITREVNYGWLIRLVHRNTASLVFVVLYIHFFRGMVQRSFYLKGPWVSGILIKILTIAAAFLGYVLPWGQISFWGATVIINLLRVVPIGKTLVIWLWGGFYVSFFTCRFFYALHFLVPFVVLSIVGVHVVLLHFRGRSVSGGINICVKIKFTHVFLYKDILNIRILGMAWFLFMSFPDWSADPVNFMPSDLSTSPIHIQPEWYFLHLYAVLRSIPNKLGGLIGFGFALIILLFLVFVQSKHSLNHFYLYTFVLWRFISVNFILLWLGIQPVEAPYILIGQVSTMLYFMLILFILAIDYIVNSISA